MPFRPNKALEIDDDVILAIAEKLGQLPDTIEREMSEYWIKRMIVVMDAQMLDQERRQRELEQKIKR